MAYAQDYVFVAIAIATGLNVFLYLRRRRGLLRLVLARERALRASDARLRSFFEATPDALLICDAQGNITLANQQIEQLLGYSMQELLGQSIDQLVPTRARMSHPQLRENFAATPSARRMGCGLAVKALHKDGSECDVEVSLNRIDTDDGIFFACALRDISERIRSKEQLLASETRLRAIIENEPDCIKLVDANGMLIDMNAAGLAMIEADTLEQVVGRPVVDMVVPEFRTAFSDLHRRVIAGESAQLEFKVLGRKGHERWLETHAVPMQDHGLPTVLSVTRDITERKIANEKIVELAFYDQLTGLPNRALLADRLKQTIAASSRSGMYGSLLFIDLDHFKTLNDTLGHDIGDLQLQHVATRLGSCMREGDTVARVGGDEFVVILEGLGRNAIDAAKDTEVVATKVLAALSQPYQLGDVSHSSTASIGATIFQGHDASVDSLMKRSDLAMYRAKDAGRNRMRFFDPSMETMVVKRVALEKDLRHAVATHQFVLHYQAQVRGFGRVTGAEVLVRWHHPERGLVFPVEFIPLAEETGLILELGNWVLQTACSQLEKWSHRPGLRHLTLAVNVSALQFGQPDFVDAVLATIARTGANPMQLKLELTESLLAGDMADIVEKMFRLKGKGIGFSLDDFGTGYSSLSYLSRMPLDQLKIDRSFVNDMVINPGDAAIARTIIGLANSLSLGVIAEGVETEVQRAFLATAGCHAYQGYFFSKPLTIEGFEAYASKSVSASAELS
jgi:diguanylate cyclase (GGDEF)-like protein/PAS domain S-box-containing protein